MHNLLAIYKNRIEVFSNEEERLLGQHKRYSIGRFVLFLICIALILILFQQHWGLGLISIYGALVLFYAIVKRHNKISRRLNIAKQLKTINELETGVLQHEFSAYPSGVEFQNEKHPFANDLDIFGKNSLFQYSNRCQTSFGNQQLSSFFMNGIEVDRIQSHQEALQELEDKIDWRQEYFAICHSDLTSTGLNKNFLTWMDQDSGINFRKVMFVLIPIITCTLLYLLISYLPMLSYFLAFIPAGLFAMKHAEKITAFQSTASTHSKTLEQYADAIQWIHSQPFDNERLQEKQSLIFDQQISAAIKIRKLSYILHQLDLRSNFFGLMVNVLFPWDYYWAYRLQQWKTTNRSHVEVWFKTIGWFEAMSSLATLGFNNPEWTIPVIHNTQYFKATEIGHPLIHSSKRVSNAFEGSTQQHIKIVTGSNMGGKSTFLRTIGLNIVLANCGARACATSLQLPYLKLYTSMRTLDALDENTSSFYAELKRLKMVLDAVDSFDNVYFLLDEILKGTNSNDRHTGAKALIKGLLKQNGSGLISTHDLELGLLEQEHPNEIENICFEVEVANDQLIFDYKLKKGVSKSFNATHLMRNMGIDV